MAVPIAELFISVGADVTAAISGLNAAGSATDRMANQFRAAAPAALLLSAAGASVAAGLTASVNVAADFEHQMSGVKAVMSPGEVETFGAALSDLALKLGRDTVFTSREAAAGIEELIKAGIPAEAVLGGAASAALSLAGATGVSVAEAATVAATAMNTFGVQASQLNTVVDVLSGTANASAADISQLQFGLQAVGPVAAQMGLSLTDTAAALGIFANNGLRGQDAGTSLKTMLLNLIPSTKKQTQEFKKLGLITADGSNIFFNAEGHLRDLADISEVLKGALAGLSDEQRISALQTLFGTDAVRAAAILYKTGGDAVNAFHGEVSKVSAEDSAKIRLDNLQGALQNLGGSVETVQIIIGNLFLPKLRELANLARAAVDRFSNLSPQMQRAVVLFVGVSGAIAGTVGGLVLLGPFIAALPKAFAALALVLPRVAALFGPIGISAAALFTNFGGVRDKLGKVFAGLTPVLSNFALVFQKFVNGDIQGAVDTFIAILGALVPGIGPIIQNVRNIIDGLAQQFGPILSNLGLVFEKVFAGDLSGALDTFRAIVGAAVPPLGEFFTMIENLARTVGPALGTVFGSIGGFLGTEVIPRIEALIPLLQEGVPKALQAIGDIAGTALGPIIGTFDLITAHGDELKTFFATTLPDALGAMATQIASLGPLFGAVFGFFGAINSLIGTLASTGATALRGLFENVLAPGLIALGNAIGPLQPILEGMGNAMTNLTTNFSTIGTLLQPATDFFNNLAGAINAASTAIQTFQLPGFLQPGQTIATGPAPQIVPPTLAPTTGVTPGGGGDINFNAPITISGGVDLAQFADAVRGAVQRVSPPVPPGQPGLVPGF